MDPGAIGAVSAAIAVPIGFAVLARVFPAPPASAGERAFEDLAAEYRRWHVGLGLSAFALALVVGFGWWKLFVTLAGQTGFAHEGDVLVLRTSGIGWALPAFFLGLACSGPLTTPLVRRLLGNARYAELIAYGDQLHHFDSERAARWLTVFVAVAAAYAVWAMADWRLVVAPTEIRFDPLLAAAERTYAYDDVVAIETAPAVRAPNGSSVPRRGFAVRFADDSAWTTNFDMAEASEAELVEVVRVVSERSGVPITEVAVIERE